MLGALKAQAVVFLGLLVHGLPDVAGMQQLISHLSEQLTKALCELGKCELRVLELEKEAENPKGDIALALAQARAQIARLRSCEANWTALAIAFSERASPGRWSRLTPAQQQDRINGLEDVVRAYHAGVK
jgi:hypothetical protein